MINEVDKLPIFDGFDSYGKSTGHKCMICLKQDIECKYQSFFGEGAFLICNLYKENTNFKCIK